MSIRRILSAMAFCLILLASSVSCIAAEPLRVVVSGPYPSFAEIDEDGTVHGFDVDFAEALCKELGRECSITNMEFDDIIPALVEGRIDFAVAGMGTNAEREKLIDFTDRYYRSVSIFIERKGSFKDITPESLKGLRIAAQTGSLQADYLTKTYGDSITLITDTSYDSLYSKLKKKEVDLVLSDGLPGYAYLSSENGAELENIGAPLDPGEEINWSRIALGKNNPAMREAINRAIQTLRRNGVYDKINRKYFDFTIY